MQSVWTGKLMQRIDAKRAYIAQHLVRGGAKDYESYKELVGYLSALDEVVRMTQEVDNEMMGVPAGAPGPSD